MESDATRRSFLSLCARLGGCCTLVDWNRRLFAGGPFPAGSPQARVGALLDLRRLSYCGIPCGEEVCEMYRMTHDVQMKQEAYDKHPQEMRALFGIETFDPDKMACHTCKPGDKPLGGWQRQCPTRRCAIENGVETCIQCGNLADCGQRTWKSMPHHHAYAKWAQARYVLQPGAALVNGKTR